MLSDDIAALRGVLKSGLRHTAGGKGIRVVVCVFAGLTQDGEERARLYNVKGALSAVSFVAFAVASGVLGSHGLAFTYKVLGIAICAIALLSNYLLVTRGRQARQALLPPPILLNFPVLAQACLWCSGAPICRA